MANGGGGITVKIGADTQDFDRGISSARQQLSDFSGRATAVVSAIAKVGAAATAAAGAIVYMTNSVAENARQLRVQAQLANTTTQEFQRQAFAARTVGVEQDKFADILKDVNDRVGDFLSTGGGEMADFFEKIAPQVGVTAEQFRRLSGPEALQLYVSSLEKANISQSEMVFYLESVADQTTSLLPLLRNNGEEMARLAEEADALGIVLSDMDLSRLQDFERQFDRITAIVEGLKNTIAVELAPVLAEVAERISDAAVEAGGFDEVVRRAVEMAVTGFGAVADAVHKVRVANAAVERTVAELQLAFAQFAEGAWRSMEGLFGLIISGINNISGAMNALGANIPELDQLAESEFFAGIKRQTDEATRSAWAAREAYHNLATQKLPSETFEEFFDRVEERRNEFQKSGGLLGGGTGRGGGGGGDGDGDGGGDEDEGQAPRFLGGPGIFGEEGRDAFLKLIEAQQQARQEILRKYDELDTERQQEKFESDMERLREALELKAITEEEFRAAEREAELEHYRKLTGIRQNSMSTLAKISADHWGSEVGLAVDSLGTIVDAMSQQSETMFKISKAAALAQATINAYEAITGAYKVGASIGGPPLGAAFAAAAGAAQFATIAKIRGQQYNGGTSGGGGAASAGGGGGGSSVGAGQGAGGGQQKPQETLVANLSVQGEVFDRKTVIGLIEQINELQTDGMRVRIDT